MQERKLEACTRAGATQCCICNSFTRAIHWHHTVPRSLGGEFSLQIPLDGDCHTALHAKANATCAFLRGNRKKPIGQYWEDPEHEVNAERWLQILVEAQMNPPIAKEDKLTLLPALSVDATTRNGLELLKRDLPGVTNIADTLLYCIQYTITSKGYNDDQGNDKDLRTKGVTKKRNDLW